MSSAKCARRAAARNCYSRDACDSMVMKGAKVEVNGTGSCISTNGDFIVNLNFVDRSLPGGPPMRFVRVTGREQMPTHFIGLLNFLAPGNYSVLPVAAMAEAGPERPIDLMLVLDRSGSMKDTDFTGRRKIVALRTAVNEFLDNNFSADDRLGMVSFATRGCGDANGKDSNIDGNCIPDVALNFATSTHLDKLKKSTSGLCGGGNDCVGGTNTMEAIRTARGPLVVAFNDNTRSVTRKVVVLVTDGQPTFMRREPSGTDCQRNPKNNVSILPSGPNGCVMGVYVYPNNASTYFVARGALSSPDNLTSYTSNSGAWYRDFIRCTRSLTGCATNGAMFEAEQLRNCGFNNSACDVNGAHDVVFFAIAIGKEKINDPQGSLDNNVRGAREFRDVEKRMLDLASPNDAAEPFTGLEVRPSTRPVTALTDQAHNMTNATADASIHVKHDVKPKRSVTRLSVIEAGAPLVQ